MLGEALWRLAHRSFQQDDLPAARRWLEENRQRVPRATIWYAEGRPEYWLGRIAEKQGARRAALAWYERALRDYPLSVYALLAAHRLEQAAPDRAAAVLRELRAAPVASPERPGRRAPRSSARSDPLALRRAIELAARRPGSRGPARAGRLGRRRPAIRLAPDRDLTGTAAALLDGAGLWNASHALVEHAAAGVSPALPGHRAAPAPGHWHTRAPTGDLVEARSRENGVPPAPATGADARGERLQSARRLHRQLPGPDHAEAGDRPRTDLPFGHAARRCWNRAPTSPEAPATWLPC